MTTSMFGNRIRRIREQKGVTLRALAREVGVSPSGLSLIERGESSPTISTGSEIAGALGVRLAELLEEHR